MKKIFLAVLMVFGFGSFALAGDDINGVITNINNANKTITINQNMVIKILPNTKIEIDGRFMDKYGNFSSFQLNDFVEVDVMGHPNAYGNGPAELVAKSVDIQRKGRKAY